jgi:hypothetical protein
VLCNTTAAPVIGSSRAQIWHNAAGSVLDAIADSVITFARISFARAGDVIAGPLAAIRRAHQTRRDRDEQPAGTCAEPTSRLGGMDTATHSRDVRSGAARSA